MADKKSFNMYNSVKFPVLTVSLLCFFVVGCSGSELKAAHEGLKEAENQFDKRWNETQERFSGDSQFLDFLKAKQKGWEDYLSFFAVNPDNAISVEKRAALIRDRAKWLSGLLENPATNESFDGVYWTAKGNSLRLKREGEIVKMGLHKYEYSYGHQGIIGGTIKGWESGKGEFRADLSTNSNKPKKIAIKFELRNGLMIVTSIGDLQSIGGPRATFEGVYSRVSPLKERDLRILKSDLEGYNPNSSK